MAEQITYLPLSALRESPSNPRRTFDDTALADLAASIQQQGVLQPVVVRPLQQADIEHGYELVFGHRRVRACRLLPDYQQDTLRVPCIVREMDDQQVALAQIAENLQRADVTALEEAAGFAELHRTHNLSADRIADRVGKSRSYVYARLKLATAGEALREAIAQQGLLPEIALEVARLRGEKLQQAGLREIRTYEGDWMSQRAAKARLRQMQTARLVAAAPFAPDDTTGGQPACSTCPLRAGNDPDLAELPPDVCTDPACWDRKCHAHTAAVVDQLREQGLPVIDGEAAIKLWAGRDVGPGALPPGYWRADAEVFLQAFDPVKRAPVQLNMAQLLQQLAEGGVQTPAPEVVTIVHPSTGTHARYVTAATRADLARLWHDMQDLKHQADMHKAGAQAAGDDEQGSPGRRDDGGMTEQERALQEWSPLERLTLDGAAWRAVRRGVLQQVAQQPRTADDLRLVLLREHDMAYLHETEMAEVMGLTAELQAALTDDPEADAARAWWQQRLQAMAPDDLAALLLGIALEHLLEPVSLGWSGTREQMARHRSRAADRVALAQRFGQAVEAAA